MPLMYMPVYYASKEMAFSGEMLWETVTKGLERCKENLITDIQLLALLPTSEPRLKADGSMSLPSSLSESK